MEDLIEQAEEAITAVFNDKSLSADETETALNDLKGFIDVMLDSLN